MRTEASSFGELGRSRRVKAGTGTSELAETGAAGRAAATTAVAALGGEPVGLVLVYGSVRYDLPALLAAIRSVTGEAPLAGATTSGHFHNGGVTAPGQGVAVLALTTGPYRYGLASATGLRTDAVGVGQRIARAARDATSDGATATGTASQSDPLHRDTTHHDTPHRDTTHSALLLLADGLAGDLQELLNGVHKVTGAVVPVVGGSAGDDRQLTGTSVFHDDQVLADGAVAIWIDSPWPLAVVAAHGWTPTSLPLLVTEVDGPVVHEIAGRPATEVFDEFFRDTRLSDRTAGWRSAQAFGLIEPDGSMLIRGAYVDDQGELRTFCPLPRYAPVEIVQCDPDDLLGITEDVVDRATDGRTPSVLLAFSCLARLDVLGQRVPEEATRLQAAAGTATTFGFYTYGEIARTTNVAGFHNGTLTAIAL